MKEVSQWYKEQLGLPPDSPDINYVWSSEGNKTLSFYMTIMKACKAKYGAWPCTTFRMLCLRPFLGW